MAVLNFDAAPAPDLDQEYAEQDGTAPPKSDTGGSPAWIEPVDIIGAPEMVGWPELTPDCLPAPLCAYVTNEAERLNVDPCALSAHVLGAVSSVCSDAWTVKPSVTTDGHNSPGYGSAWSRT
jgi:hypothetical protein